MKDTNDMYLERLISDFYKLSGTCNSSHIESIAKKFDVYITKHNNNVYNYEIATKAVGIINEFLGAVYEYTADRYGKEFADEWASPEDTYADADQLYIQLMKTVCF